MTAFTSVTSGNWNDGATWGLTSPGVKGTDWPGTAGDTFNVAAGHTVTYNVSETNALGTSAISGILTFSTGASTKLTMGGYNLTVNNGGELIIGTTTGSAIIGAAYTAELLWDMGTTADGTVGLVIAAGGKFTAAGDPSYYGSTDASDQTFMRAVTVSCATTSLVVEGDYSGWNCNDVLYVYRNAAYSSWLTDVVPVQIHASTVPSYNAGTDQTTITLTAATSVTGTFYAGGYAWNVSRNVKVGKLIADAEPWPINNSGSIKSFTYRPNITNSGAITDDNVNVSSICFQGIYRYGYNFASGRLTGSDVVLRHIGRIEYCYKFNVSSGVFCCIGTQISGIRKCDIGADIISNQNYRDCTTCSFTGKQVCGYYIVNAQNDTEYADIIGMAYGFYTSSGKCTINGYVYGNQYLSGNGGCEGLVFDSCVVDEDPKGVLKANTYCISPALNINILHKNCSYKSTPTVSARNLETSINGRVRLESYDQVLEDDRVIACFGNAHRVSADGAGSPTRPDPRDSSYDQVIQVDTLSNCSATNPMLILNPDKFQTYCAAGEEKEIRVYIQSTVALTNAEISLTAQYLDGDTNSSRTTVTSTEAIDARADETDWTQYLSVSLTGADTPQIDGYVYLELNLMKQVNGPFLGGTGTDAVFVWPIPVEICENPIVYGVIWDNAEVRTYQKDAVDATLIAQTLLSQQVPGTYADGSVGKTISDTYSTATSLNDLSITDIANHIVEGALTLDEVLRIFLSVLAGKSTDQNTSSPKFRDMADSKNRIVATTDSDNNRTNIVLDGT